MKHTTLGIVSGLIAGAITMSLHVWGAHDLQGLLSMIAGYPGLLANGDYTRLNEVLFTGVNWTFYFALFEGVAGLKGKFSK